MMIHRYSLLTLIIALMLCGCRLGGLQQKTRYVAPVLPASMSCQDLVDHLNRQSHGLHAWRSTDAVLTARLPNGLPLRLSANIACSAPKQFRLKASNLVADVDLGANHERCWFYTKPGEGKVLTWRHEDAELLQNLSVGVPRIDPEWLMVVLGVMPLDSTMFNISSGPEGARELWLTSVSDDFDGRPLRRVIKVDQVSGRIREHVVYNHQRSPLIRAALSQHRTVQGYLVPQVVRLEFPQMDTEMTLKFGRIEPNCALAEALWQLPSHRNVDVLDLGNAVRVQLNSEPRQQPGYSRPTASATAELTPSNSSARLLDGSASGHQEPWMEPETGSDIGQTYVRGVSQSFLAPPEAAGDFYDEPDEDGHNEEMAETPEWDLPAEPRGNAAAATRQRGWSMNWRP